MGTGSLSAGTATCGSGRRGTARPSAATSSTSSTPPAAAGIIFASDHSVTSGVSGATYEYIVGLVREAGRYPLSLGEFAVEV